jgi:hypothetical protein
MKQTQSKNLLNLMLIYQMRLVLYARALTCTNLHQPLPYENMPHRLKLLDRLCATNLNIPILAHLVRVLARAESGPPCSCTATYSPPCA